MSRRANGIDAAIQSLTSEQLVHFLTRQRWFGAKGEAPTGASVVDWVPLACDATPLAVARIRVETSAGPLVYQVPIAARAQMLDDPPQSALIAVVAHDGGTLHLFDAVHEPAFRALIADAVRIGFSATSSSATKWLVEPTHAAADLSVGAPTCLVGVEQSNTSLIVGDRAVVKLFRRLASGANPDVEVTRFLTTQARFTHTPEFLGELRFEDASGSTTAGMTQSYVPGATDLWTYALERARPYFAAPDGREEPNAFPADAKALGAVTRAMHTALASRDDDPSFAPEPASSADVERWAHRTQQSIRDSLGLLERQLATPAFPRDRLPEAQALVRRRDRYIEFVDEITDELDDDVGLCTRIHGDFHLGQVLRAPDGELMIIDFEGQPSTPLNERREKTSPLRDVAGMLRSFAYAAATLAMRDAKQVPPHVRELRSGRWERDVRNAFLEAYFSDPADRTTAAASRGLVTLFEAEKAFYELSYELNHRPTWAWIPMRGISKLLVAQ